MKTNKNNRGQSRSIQIGFLSYALCLFLNKNTGKCECKLFIYIRRYPEYSFTISWHFQQAGCCISYTLILQYCYCYYCIWVLGHLQHDSYSILPCVCFTMGRESLPFIIPEINTRELLDIWLALTRFYLSLLGTSSNTYCVFMLCCNMALTGFEPRMESLLSAV